MPTEVGRTFELCSGISLGITAARLASGSGGGASGDQQQKSWTGQLLSLPAGRLLVGAVALVIVGVLIGIAALHRNAGEASGLDAALRTVASQSFGTAALVVVALGLAAYGVYCFAAAKAHKA